MSRRTEWQAMLLSARDFVRAEHPEWAQLNAEGTRTNTEALLGRKYNIVWMCPAHRPGYTDQWLLPLIEELAEALGLTVALAMWGNRGPTIVRVAEAATPRQRVLEGTLGTIAEAATQAGLKPPALLVVGPVVALRQHLQWWTP